MANEASGYLFLTGAGMDPASIRTHYPDARFVARAHVEARQGEINPAFGHAVAASGLGQVWGIVIQTPGVAMTGRAREVTTDDGRTIEAEPTGDRFANGESAAVLKAAQYWELPPGYVARLVF